jgi:thioredoxin-dependent peroxiredoxin
VVSEGDVAPDFTVATDTGESVSLSDFRGKPVVLYFYPKDDTRASFVITSSGSTSSHA